MIYLDHPDEFAIINVLVCTIIYWTKLMMSHNVRLFVVMMTKVLYGMDFQS